ncbi:polyprenyl synthetase family protein [Mycolicibacterium farcinogenes]|uniref:polyprenyl synthetase family protein n=1 Tax=Mycolicibacterium farcinogenes TaxID=1802 RepID=UPI0021AD50E7|nr:polyprenyl synthetase family protein [Mycolicibacterium farcinogenes]
MAGPYIGDGRLAGGLFARLAEIDRLIADELRSRSELMSEALAALTAPDERRLRPFFTLLAASSGPDPDATDVSTAGAVVEMVHLAALHHDTVLDEDEVQRSGRGPAARWSNNLAILAGDYLFATASRLVSRLGPDAVRVIADTFARLVNGQVREARGVPAGSDEIEHYLSVCHERVACLFGTAGRFGATYSGAGPDQADKLAAIGDNVGMVLQISEHIASVDDIDVLRRGNRTLPVLYALREQNAEATRLHRLLSPPDATDDVLTEAVALVRSSSGIAESRRKLVEYADRATTILSQLPAGDGREALASWIAAVADNRQVTWTS